MKRSKFGQAFAEARKAGKKTFDFEGKSYTTETKEEKAGAIAKKATRSFAANAVPGRRQAKPKPSGGGSVATPSRGPSKERRGAGAIGRDGKDPSLPRTTFPEDPITLGKLAKAGAKGVATGIAAGVPLVRAGRGMLGAVKTAKPVREGRGAAELAKASARKEAIGTLAKKLKPKAVKTAVKEMKSKPMSGRAQFRKAK